MNKMDQPSLTQLEELVLDFIKENTDIETMDCVDIKDLSKSLNESPKTLRGVISSLVKKDLIEVEEYDANDRREYFYWLKT